MYKCFDCGEKFEQPVKIYDDPSPMGVSLPRGFYVYFECPYCHSEDIEETNSEDEEDADE